MLSGMIFESFAQLQFQEKLTTLALVRMEYEEARGRANAKWKYGPSSAGAGDPLRIQLEPTETIEYDEAKWSGLESNVFHVPISSSQVAFDAFILVDEVFLHLSVYHRYYAWNQRRHHDILFKSDAPGELEKRGVAFRFRCSPWVEDRLPSFKCREDGTVLDEGSTPICSRA